MFAPKARVPLLIHAIIALKHGWPEAPRSRAEDYRPMLLLRCSRHLPGNVGGSTVGVIGWSVISKWMWETLPAWRERATNRSNIERLPPQLFIFALLSQQIGRPLCWGGSPPAGMSVATVNSHCSVGERRVKSELDGWRKARNVGCSCVSRRPHGRNGNDDRLRSHLGCWLLPQKH